MFIKLYESIIKIIKENYKFLLCMILLVFTFTFKLPYYINAPGGLIDISDRVDIDNEISGSLNMVYVLEMQATIPTYLFSLINTDWELIPKSEYTNDEDTSNLDLVGKLLLEESTSNAMIAAFKASSIDFTITNEKVYTYYVLEEANTTLEMGDQILEINNIPILNKQHLSDVINSYNDNTKLEIKTDNGIKEAVIFNEDDTNYIGIGVVETKDVSSTKDIDFFFEDSESGPSGGLMITLSLYGSLNNIDITNNLKIAGTGTIDELGNVGPIGGIKLKIKAADENDVNVFFSPIEHCDEAKSVDVDNMEIVCVSTFNEALNYLEK